MSVRINGVIALLAIAPALAAAATPINQSRPLNGNGQVHIENIKGRIVVRTWGQPQVRVTGSLGKGAEKLEISGDANSLNIEVKYPDSGGWSLWGRNHRDVEDSVLEVTLPRGASVDVDSVSADVDVQQMAGRRLSVSSVSGQVLVTASSPGQASFENVSGDTTLRITSNKVDAESVSGDIRLQGGLAGEVSLESVSGNLALGALSLSRLQVSTVSGDAKLQAGLKPGGVFKGETLSGELVLRLPAASNARLHVETFSGDITSPVGSVHREEHGPGKSLDATLGAGGGQIRLESFSGDVTVQTD
jgi:DUF4097 and DUF4098 domain-containing protein YvlB